MTIVKGYDAMRLRDRWSCDECGTWWLHESDALSHACGEVWTGTDPDTQRFREELAQALLHAKREAYARALTDVAAVVEAMPTSEGTLRVGDWIDHRVDENSWIEAPVWLEG